MSHYEVYRLLPEKNYDELRHRPFIYLKEHHIKIRADIYEIIAKEPLDGSETVKDIRDRLEQDESVMGPHTALAVSDVIVVPFLIWIHIKLKISLSSN